MFYSKMMKCRSITRPTVNQLEHLDKGLDFRKGLAARSTTFDIELCIEISEGHNFLIWCPTFVLFS